MSFNTLDLKSGDKVGVFFYDNAFGSKAEIHEVKNVTRKGRGQRQMALCGIPIRTTRSGFKRA
ncbi:hypothetical protein DSM106972_027300 [Dulcicalothrix desertica PCC 7102]|uniref:Uncharacterized protein n=1 Tax=Dulcicalothrix desertica PCC 7102 TaxID=232991 RepID=A0A3S1B7J1_9CYAN|nr:hypothetical protein [Dulcicalothrix desertica]RUT06473.1 hypothetical protein DSM106972_027300 [Dulcicalothrix desertica PCC 7102]TWH62636.1 hypothetical protein CAL7102_00135 [Dulcicalothrix desertica PCC 7102]